jgi:hypothetical protein
MKSKLITVLVAGMVAAAAASTASAAPRDNSAAYGEEVQLNTTGRVIDLTPATRFVNVTNGETVTFKKGSQRFTWHVDVYSNVSEFALAKIAPHSLNFPDISVYVAASDQYQD